MGLVVGGGWSSSCAPLREKQRVSQLQADFVAAVSHEFRSPLTSLSHIAEMLAQDRVPSERRSPPRVRSARPRHRPPAPARRGPARFRPLRGRCAAFSSSVWTSPPLVHTTVADFQDRVAADGYTIHVTGPVAAQVHADREAISRALWNLLDNAVKYSPECRTRLGGSHGEPGDRVVDRGARPGHRDSRDEQREIFDRFVRGADPKGSRIKGTGIGLAMVRQIVRGARGTGIA